MIVAIAAMKTNFTQTSSPLVALQPIAWRAEDAKMSRSFPKQGACARLFD
jgi:hypothetical protein